MKITGGVERKGREKKKIKGGRRKKTENYEERRPSLHPRTRPPLRPVPNPKRQIQDQALRAMQVVVMHLRRMYHVMTLCIWISAVINLFMSAPM